MGDTDLMLTLALDYAPILSPPAMSLYLCYCALRDENGIAEATYVNLQEHLGISNGTIAKYNNELKAVGLITPIGEDNGPPVASAIYRKNSLKILHPVPLTNKRRKELFKERSVEAESEIRKKALTPERLPLEHQRLLSRKDLQEAFKKLKRARFTVGNLVEHFKLDQNRVRLWLSNREFKAQLLRAMKKVVDEASRIEVQQELKKAAKKPASKIKTADEMYEMLMKAGLDKDGKPIPVEKWTQPSQLLRYFCILYERYNAGRKYTIIFPNSKNFSSKEIRDMTTMLRAFNDNIPETVKYMEWLFENKEEVLQDGIFGTGIFRTPGMINEYKKKASRPVQIRDSDPIDETYITWIKENANGIFDVYDLERMKDLYWLKVAYDGERRTEDVATVVEEGIRRGIIPKVGNIQLK